AGHRAAPRRALSSPDQQPTHWSGVLSSIRLSVRVTGNPSVKRPPPSRVTPGLPVSGLPVTLVGSRVTGGGESGATNRSPVHIPPPGAEPVNPSARPVLSLIWSWSSNSAALLRKPAPSTVASPPGAEAVTVLLSMRLFVIVIVGAWSPNMATVPNAPA